MSASAGRAGVALPALVAAVALLGLVAAAAAGEIAGLPPATPPFIPQRAEISVGNDIFGRGGLTDDHRTQQLVLALPLGERWVTAVEHSMLTLEKDTATPGRLDQLAASVGYRFGGSDGEMSGWSLLAGAGLRRVGNFGGARIQNGFHRLFDQRSIDLPYVETRQTDATGWLRLEHFAPFPGAGSNVPGAWRFGYWVQASGLASSDGQQDAALLGALTASRGWFGAWLGLRGDWREGYDADPVQREAARNDAGGFVVVGLRAGPVLLETSQGFQPDKAFGRLSFVADLPAGDWPRPPGGEWSLAGGFTVPELYLGLQGRGLLCGWLPCSERRHWRAVLDLRRGQPPLDSANDRYLDAWQFGAGLELEVAPAWLPRWLTLFGSAGAGWRSEQLKGDRYLTGAASERVGRAVGFGELGLRASTIGIGRHWGFRIQAALSGWLPAGSKRVSLAGRSERLQEPGIALLLGGVIEFRP
ncbi:MAG: hypothetical protein D6727_05365 [Gammaproteobacteria bacterium]|nr:MAG: hypothetical protein D6727_05365 [Gammaproteobacteria bacterium]